MYENNCAPWDIGESQPAIRQLAALGAVRGHTLDAGCGTGWNSIELARAGASVVGIDAAMSAVARARRNARNAGVTASFELGGVTSKLASREGFFDSVVDSKCLDNIEDDSARQRYLAALHRATKPSARLFVLAFDPDGSVNGFHCHEPELIDYTALLTGAGFAVDYVGASTYQLNAKDWQPLCDACPREPPGERLHIPVIEIHATRKECQ